MISQGPSVCIFNKEDPQEVLASWLFAQYLLTNDVQISYSQTEGYVPVTTKAQESNVYQEYLSKAGEDNELHYGVKLAASKLLIQHTENTFVTPVFNGSMNLRNAAGQLIEEVTSSAYRKQTIDEAYMFKLFRNMTSLYRLGEIDFGALSGTAVVLLSALAVCWVSLGAAWIYRKRKMKNR
jgi:multiple sugar transport system substrate-binding protein